MQRCLLALILTLLACGCAREPAAPDAAATDAASDAAADALDVVELSAADARDRMRAGTLTSRALTQAYLDRIAAMDDDGPRLNAVIETNPSALADAEALDAERSDGRERGPLHGIPILIKDNIDVAGLVNSAGSLALAEHRPARDAFAVARLREVGAVILGKTNLSEWANFRSTRSSSGWSSRGGQTRNPYVLDRNPCGSSAGTGTAIAASFAAIGIGTETDGSIICPSAVAGLVGLKPTVGLVSRGGIIPISISQDTAGPMGRSVRDVAMLLGGIAGVDEADPAGPEAAGRIPDDYEASLDAGALSGARVGLLRQALGVHPDVDAAVLAAVDAIRMQGAEVVDVTIDDYEAWGDDEFEVLLYEFKDGLNRYLRESGAPQPSLAALIEWNRANADRAMPFFGQEIFERAEAKGPLTDAAYREARDRARRMAGADGLLAALARERLDAIVAPSMSAAWVTDHVLGDHFVGGAGYGMAAVAGTPSLTLPVGEASGLPIGLTFMGPAYSEPALLGFGFALERVLEARRAPQYADTLSPISSP